MFPFGGERETVWQRECVCVCVCERERERERETIPASGSTAPDARHRHIRRSLRWSARQAWIPHREPTHTEDRPALFKRLMKNKQPSSEETSEWLMVAIERMTGKKSRKTQE